MGKTTERRAVTSRFAMTILTGAAVVSACQTTPPPAPRSDLIARGERIFFGETFEGNGRTCGTCHRPETNFTITPEFIATLPNDDPLFVAEFNPDLAKNFENPKLMRKFGLILRNPDGFDDVENKFVLRGVPHVLALHTSVDSVQGPRIGWSGDGAPADGSLRSFVVDSVTQHFTRTLSRVPGTDFRLPTGDELDALEAFMLSLGRKRDLTLPLPLRGALARKGQEIFLDDSLGKCNVCHANAGANTTLSGHPLGNANFDTGVEDLSDPLTSLAGVRVPRDDGFGSPGDGSFNTPPLVESADSGPFFHNNAVPTLEGAVSFYTGNAFNASPSGRLLAALDPNGVGIRLDGTQVRAVAAFLRVINALENIRVSETLLRESLDPAADSARKLERSIAETGDAIEVLSDAGLHPPAIELLWESKRLIIGAIHREEERQPRIRQAIAKSAIARRTLVGPPPTHPLAALQPWAEPNGPHPSPPL